MHVVGGVLGALVPAGLARRRAGLEHRTGQVGVVAGDGAEAILKLLGAPYSLVLMDWYMPDISGAGLLRVLRDQRFGPASQTPVIVMTGYPTQSSMAQARALGTTAILPKPFSIEHLAATLGRVLGSPQAHDDTAYV